MDLLTQEVLKKMKKEPKKMLASLVFLNSVNEKNKQNTTWL